MFDLRYEAREAGGVGSWVVVDTSRHEPTGEHAVAATYWGWVHPDAEHSAKVEAHFLNIIDETS